MKNLDILNYNKWVLNEGGRQKYGEDLTVTTDYGGYASADVAIKKQDIDKFLAGEDVKGTELLSFTRFYLNIDDVDQTRESLLKQIENKKELNDNILPYFKILSKIDKISREEKYTQRVVVYYIKADHDVIQLYQEYYNRNYKNIDLIAINKSAGNYTILDNWYDHKFELDQPYY